MSFVRALSCSMCAGLGVLLLAASPFAPDEITARLGIPGSFGPNPRIMNGDAMSRPDGFSACIDAPDCIMRYLWSVYERTPKLDGGRDFAWKDFDAAEKAGMSPMAYVIGGMDPWFRVTLYRALRTLDAAGFKPGLTCGFRDDYRQSITAGKMRAQNDRSFHGGSFRGGYGHGLAADVVSIKGSTRAEQSASSDRMWSWIDAHEKELGIGRPYLWRDPPHVAPIDGEEYATHRLLPNHGSGPRTGTRQPLAAPSDQAAPKRAGTASPSTRSKPPSQPIAVMGAPSSP